MDKPKALSRNAGKFRKSQGFLLKTVGMPIRSQGDAEGLQKEFDHFISCLVTFGRFL